MMDVRRALIWFALLSVPACGWLSMSDEPHFTDATSLTAPWTKMKLPVESGKVTVSDADTVSVHHAQGSSAELGEKYGAALAADGWTKGADMSSGDIVNQTWTKGDQSLALSILDHDGERIVSMSILPF